MKRFILIGALAACSGVPTRHFESENDLKEIQAVMQRDFHERGSAKLERLEPDALQRACNLYDNAPPEDIAKKLEAEQLAAIRFPAANLLGDWQRAQAIAQDGRGLQWTDRPGAGSGGSCYNCHELSPQEASHGTLGPSLRGFGKLRGNGADIQRYAFGRIYNSKAYNACSQMPRLGHSGTLNEQQIKDLVAYLLDPESPVNK